MPSARKSLLYRVDRSRRMLLLVCRRLRCESGSALIELALTLGILGVPLLLGTVHFSILLIDSMVVSNAAHAGAEYGMASATYASDTSYIVTAAQEDASGLGATLNVTPTIFYVCSTAIAGTQYTTQSAANTACSSSHSLEFLQVVASSTVTPVLSFPGFPNSVTLSSTSIMEVEE
jgi:Flp pilus assembly protein TadG